MHTLTFPAPTPLPVLPSIEPRGPYCLPFLNTDAATSPAGVFFFLTQVSPPCTAVTPILLTLLTGCSYHSSGCAHRTQPSNSAQRSALMPTLLVNRPSSSTPQLNADIIRPPSST